MVKNNNNINNRYNKKLNKQHKYNHNFVDYNYYQIIYNNNILINIVN